VGIGGITPERAHDVAKTGACGAAVIGAVMSAEDPAGAVRALLSAFD
jgi:thiamine monophosphate synthase